MSVILKEKHDQHEQIVQVLGVDPSKHDKGTEVFNEVLEKIKKEREEAAKGRVEKEVRELYTLVEQRDKIVKEFNSKQQELDKKIAKAFNRVKGIQGGQEVKEEEEKKENE